MTRVRYETPDRDGEVALAVVHAGDVVRTTAPLGAGGLTVRTGEIGEVLAAEPNTGHLRIRAPADGRPGVRDLELDVPPDHVLLLLDARDPRIGASGGAGGGSPRVSVLRKATRVLARHGFLNREEVLPLLAAPLRRVVAAVAPAAWTVWSVAAAAEDERERERLLEEGETPPAPATYGSPLWDEALLWDVRWAVEAMGSAFEVEHDRRPVLTSRADVLEVLEALEADLRATTYGQGRGRSERDEARRTRSRLQETIDVIRGATDQEWEEAVTWPEQFRLDVETSPDELFAPRPGPAPVPIHSELPAEPSSVEPPVLAPTTPTPTPVTPTPAAPAAPTREPPAAPPGVPVGLPPNHPESGLRKVWARPGTQLYHRKLKTPGVALRFGWDDSIDVRTAHGEETWDAIDVVVDFRERTLERVQEGDLRRWRSDRARRLIRERALAPVLLQVQE